MTLASRPTDQNNKALGVLTTPYGWLWFTSVTTMVAFMTRLHIPNHGVHHP